MKRKEALQTAKPILFNTEMVQAILGGRKTVTRRVAFPNRDLREFHSKNYPDSWSYRGRVGKFGEVMNCINLEKPCKYKVGDVLYVRETWAYISDWIDVDSSVGVEEGYIYKAELAGDEHPKWHPSIHMPKEAARIFLRVTDVRVERLQDITDEQVIAEGVDIPKTASDEVRCLLAFARYPKLWNSTVKKSDLDKYGWAANPWVWVIEFERTITND